MNIGSEWRVLKQKNNAKEISKKKPLNKQINKQKLIIILSNYRNVNQNKILFYHS